MYLPPLPPGQLPSRWRYPLDRDEQVFNADTPIGNLAPVSAALGDAVKAAWLPTLPGQAVPLIGEEVPGGSAGIDP